MKYATIQDIAVTSTEFMSKVINQYEALDHDVLMERLGTIFHQATEHNDDTIDIDYKKMCFTVHLDRVLGLWQLCNNASYYPDGFLDDDPSESIIDIELF